MYREISHNKLVTWLILVGFVIFIVFVCFVYSYLYDYGWLGIIFGLIFSVPSVLIGYYVSDQIVLSMAGAREVTRKDNKDLYNLVDNLAIASGLPKPKIYVVDDPAMNAFATGRDPNHAVVAFTTGLLNNLSRTELEGVAAHELSHIKNFDTRLSTVVIIFVGLIVVLAEWFIRFGRFGSNRSKNNTGSIFAIFGVIVIILSPLVAQLIQLALSRTREYLADADAALLTRYPQGLIGALEKLSNQNNLLQNSSNVMNHMYITDPVKSLSGNGKSFWGDLFSTHPPVEERIKKLKEMIK